MNRVSPPRRAFAGFTLVETMVAIVIGMLATFIVMQVYAISEGQKRTTTGGADAQSDAAAALYLMERDLRQAGYGLSANPEDFTPPFIVPTSIAGLTSGVLAQCATVQAYNTTRGAAFTYDNSTFAPVVINPATIPPIPPGDAGTDVVLVNYGASSGVIGKGLPLATPGTRDTGGNLLSFVVDKGGSPDPRAGFVQGDMYLAVPAPASGLNCTIGEVTGLPGGANCSVGDPLWQPYIERNLAAYSSYYTGCAAGLAVNATWNQVGGDDVDYKGGRLYNLGPVGAFVSRVYAVRKGNLTVCDFTKKNCTADVADPPDPTVWTPIASGVVGLRAQYGVDTDFNGTVDAWNTDALLGAARAELLAVRLGLAVRSSQYERDPVTTVAPVWHADAGPLTGDIDFWTTATAPSSDWDHYRYKTAQSIVPVRNMIWGEQN